jgi:hypothetical protein
VSTYHAYGQAGGTVANQAAYWQLWNPSTTRRIILVRAALYTLDSGGGVNRPQLVRSTGRGATPNASVTPNANSSHNQGSAPPSAAVFELGPFGTAPTLASPAMYTPVAFIANGADGFDLPLPRGIIIPPGAGVVCTWLDTTATDTIVGVEGGVMFED